MSGLLLLALLGAQAPDLERRLLDVEARVNAAWDQGRHEAVQALTVFADAHPNYARVQLSLGYRHADRAAGQGTSAPAPAKREGYLRLDNLFALATKEWALRERAARVEQDAGRAAALVEEADRVAARVKALRNRTP